MGVSAFMYVGCGVLVIGELVEERMREGSVWGNLCAGQGGYAGSAADQKSENRGETCRDSGRLLVLSSGHEMHLLNSTWLKNRGWIGGN